MLKTTPYSKATWEIYNKLIFRFGNELNVLLNVSNEDVEKVVDKKIAELIIKNREGRIKIMPGYDGVYGKLDLDEVPKEETDEKQGVKRFL